MAKRPSLCEVDSTGCEMNGGTKKARVLSEEAIEALVTERIESRLAAAAQAPVPRLLQESFTPNDPVHGLMHLPLIVKHVVDTLVFQRMRHIKQLGLCALVFPGATHNRFFHSIGTAYLAHELVKGLRFRQPDLRITNRDALCALMAGLCHDLGHPCFSHMFEFFVQDVGCEKRGELEAKARLGGRPHVSADEDALLHRYENWRHEAASTMLLRELFNELRGPLEEAGLTCDSSGDDWTCIQELIDPPKVKLETLLEEGNLRTSWSSVIKGRPVEKAWLYEIVSNWRSGIDVDKFDYFRRDALYLGIQRQFDHDRYMRSVRVIPDRFGVLTMSPPEKDRNHLRDNMMELRRTLHRTAYQHKTVKKLECHMIDALKRLDEAILVTGAGGEKMRLSEAAVRLDPVAYPQLTDTFVEARLLYPDSPALEAAAEIYKVHILRRQMMRLVGDWDLPRLLPVPRRAALQVPRRPTFRGARGRGPRRRGDPAAAGAQGARRGPKRRSCRYRPCPLPKRREVIEGVLREYPAAAALLHPGRPPRPVPSTELHCQAARFHYGMGARDPIARVVFHSSKREPSQQDFANRDVQPLQQKVFLFWNPPVEDLQDERTLQSLTLAFDCWAESLVAGNPAAPPAAPAAPLQHGIAGREAKAATDIVAVATQPAASAPSRPRRTLQISASCPVDPPLLRRTLTAPPWA